MATCTLYQTVKRLPLSKKRLLRTAEIVLKRVRRPNGSVSIHCIGDDRMHTLNRVYRGIDRPTDVLSFAAGEGIMKKESGEEIGDIFLSIPYLERQARRVGVPVEEECMRMLIHGILHAVGYDHGKKKDAAIMFALQEDILHHAL